MAGTPNNPAVDASLAGQQLDLIAMSTKVGQTFKTLSESITKIGSDVQKLITIVHTLDQATAKAGGSRGGATFPNPATTTPKPSMGTSTSIPVGEEPGRKPKGGGGQFGQAGPPGLRAFAQQVGGDNGPRVFGFGIAAAAAATIVGGVDRRIAQGKEYASGADKLSVLTQQITGMSQMQVMTNMRKPLTNYRLGPGGINQMLAFQASTGYMATPKLASSIAGISAATGYSKSTADILADQRALLNPQVANRMFTQLGGVNAYTMGGQMRDPMQMRQQIVKSMGLTNKFVLKGAAGPGSVTRSRMTQAGIPEEMQDDIIQYAQEQQTFQRKGGKGMYDPSKVSDRKRMGIEGNLATQQQETDRLRTGRDENFMRKQIDNMTTSERQTQTMIKLLGGIEDRLSSLVGARTGTGGWQRLAGRGLQMAGLGVAATLGWTGVGAGVGLGAAALGTAISGSGDPVDPKPGVAAPSTNLAKTDSTHDATISVPAGYGGGRTTLNALKGRSDFKKMNPKMQDRLLSMFRANPNVGLGQGFRSSDQQKQMFTSRYRRTSAQTKIFYDGSYWEHVSGAPAAPPGGSMHEIGFAADLIGDMNWMNANAGRFGLKHFAGVNGEPWHVQPSDMPNSRSEFEHGTGMPSTPATTGGGTTGHANTPVLGDEAPGGGGSGAGPSNYSGLSISQIIEAVHNDNVSRLGSSGGVLGRSSGNTAKATPGTPLSISPVSFAKGAALSGADVARVAYNAGFRGDALIKFVGIAMRESGGHTTSTNMKGLDNSFGLWQINMKGALGPERLKQFGLKSREDLYDPNINARVAFEMSGGGKNMGPWGIKGNPMARVDQTAAAQYVKQAGISGDPMPMGAMGPRGGGGSLNISSSPQITVAPVINFNGMPQSQDLQMIAREVTQLIQQQVRTVEMRNS